MTMRMTWICDGCDDEITVRMEATAGAAGDDWKQITVEIKGFSGFPVGAATNGTHSYELCPACQLQVGATFFPRRWPRAKEHADA